MKKIVILTIIWMNSLYSGILSAVEIMGMVDKIKEKRVGVSLSELDGTVNPFILYVVPKKVLEEKRVELIAVVPLDIVYTLKAILNKAAFIDTKWYKKGDSIGDYTIGHISSTSVVLKSTDGNKILKLNKKKKKLIKLSRGYR